MGVEDMHALNHEALRVITAGRILWFVQMLSIFE